MRSKSCSVLAFRTCRSMPRAWAAESTSRFCGSGSTGGVGLTGKANTPALGSNSCSKFNHFGAVSFEACVRPGALPRRRAAGWTDANFDWIGSRFKNDRNGFGRRLRCQRRRSAARGNDCDLSTNEFSGQRRQAIITAFSPTVLNREVLAVDQTRFTQALPKRCHTIGVGLRGAGTEEPDHRHTRLLRPRREGPCSRSTKERDEFAAFHSSVSRARTEDNTPPVGQETAALRDFNAAYDRCGSFLTEAIQVASPRVSDPHPKADFRWPAR